MEMIPAMVDHDGIAMNAKLLAKMTVPCCVAAIGVKTMPEISMPECISLANCCRHVVCQILM